jgi:hypothetical protein
MILRRIFFKSIPLFLVLSLLMVSFSSAQRLTGKIVGTVTDEEGISLPGVSIEITSPAMMGMQAQLTDADGFFRFINLPPGTYKMVIKLEGFQTIENEKIILSIGGTVTQNTVIKPITLEESVTVIAESPVVDVTKSSLSTNYNTTQLEKLPFARSSYFDIVNQTAGFATMHGETSSRFTAYGSNSEENAMYVDGVDQSNPEIGTAWLWNTPDEFAEVEISGIGAPAEYGNFTGAVVNIVTKSGGNTFSGTAGYYGQYDSLSGDNNPDPEKWDSYHRAKFYDIAFTLGGPIIKDGLWFFVTFQKSIDSMTDFQDDPTYPSEYKGDEQFIKFSTQIASTHKLVIGFNRQYAYYPGTVDPWTMPESVDAEEDISYSWNALYTWLISNDAFFELKYAGYWSPNEMMPCLGGDVNDPYHYDGATGINSGAPYWPWEYIVSRNQLNATVTYFAEDFLAGDHDFKVGVQYNRGTSEAWGGYSGGKYYYDWYDYPYILYEQNIWRYGGITNSIGVFVDDSWKIGDRLTLNLGIRYDHHNASIPPLTIMDGWDETSEKGPAVDDVIVWNPVSPRVGLAFQLTSDQKTLLKASYGRYFTYPYINLFEWPGPNNTDWFAYWWDGSEWILYDYLPGEQGYTVDPSLKNPYSDQFSVGIERELIADLSIGVTYIYKNSKNTIGYEDRGTEFEQVQRVSPDNNQSYNVWNRTSGPASKDIWLTNPGGKAPPYNEEWGSTYQGVILILNKRYSNNWLMNMSLTWQKTEGLNMTSRATGSYSSSQALPYYTGQFGDDPNDLINARGATNLDKRWLFKLSLGYSFPWDILLSMNYTMNTGRPYPTYVRVYELDQYAHYTTILENPKGDDRFYTMHKVDFRVQKTFNLYKSFKLHAFADIFNLLNDDTVTRFRTYNMWRDDFQEPMWIPYPRRVQIGIKLEF